MCWDIYQFDVYCNAVSYFLTGEKFMLGTDGCCMKVTKQIPAMLTICMWYTYTSITLAFVCLPSFV